MRKKVELKCIVPYNLLCSLPFTAIVIAYTAVKVGKSIPNSLAFFIGYPKITSTSNGRPSLESVCILLKMPGTELIFRISSSTNSYPMGTSHRLATSITSRINRLVIPSASGDECNHVCVSTSVSVVSGFHAAFHTTFSHRLTWIFASTWNTVPPCFSKSAKVSSLACSVARSIEGLAKSPICMSSDLVCLIRPGAVWVAPTHVTQLRMEFCGNEVRKGSSLPTPFWMMTKVVLASTQGWNKGGIASGFTALWAQTM